MRTACSDQAAGRSKVSCCSISAVVPAIGMVSMALCSVGHICRFSAQTSLMATASALGQVAHSCCGAELPM